MLRALSSLSVHVLLFAAFTVVKLKHSPECEKIPFARGCRRCSMHGPTGIYTYDIVLAANNTDDLP